MSFSVRSLSIYSNAEVKDAFSSLSVGDTDNSESSPLVPKPKGSNMTRKGKLLLAMLGTVHFSAFTVYSIITPFFPTEMVRKGGNATYASWVVSCYQISILFMAPVFGKLVSVLGSRIMLLTGMCTLSLCCLFFG